MLVSASCSPRSLGGATPAPHWPLSRACVEPFSDTPGVPTGPSLTPRPAARGAAVCVRGTLHPGPLAVIMAAITYRKSRYHRRVSGLVGAKAGGGGGERGIQRVYGQGLLLTPIAPDVWSVRGEGGGEGIIYHASSPVSLSSRADLC